MLVGLFGGTLEKTEVGFEQMNTALKQRVEGLAAAASSHAMHGSGSL